jgi:7-carboxy-7-deazaguanine synthase
VITALYPIHEVFTSIQGEGAFLGEAQVFVRLDGCPLRCSWCDTPGTWKLPAEGASMEGDDHLLEKAWNSAEEIAAGIEALDPDGSRTVSVTGGEPLMWPHLLPELRQLLPDRRLHLETAGAFPGSLKQVLESVDHISADHKLPEDLRPPVALRGELEFEPAPVDASDWRSVRREVLALIADRDACAKLVVAGGRSTADFDEILQDHASLAPGLPLYVQPATAIRDVPAPDSQAIFELADRASALGLSTRVVPQLHVQLGLR